MLQSAGPGHLRADSRETNDRWRDRIVHQIAPCARDTVLDVGCGAGELAVMLKLDSPGAKIFGFDTRPGLLDLAERRAYAADARVNFVHATFDDVEDKLAAQTPTQIVCSRVLGHLTVHRRRTLLAAIFAALPRGGVLHLADAGWFRLSGLFAWAPWSHTTGFSAHALTLIRNAGFTNCVETGAFPAGNGHVTLFRGEKL